MSEITLLRRAITAHNKDFIAKDFIQFPHVHAILNKMEQQGEIITIGHVPRPGGGRQSKLYRIVDIGNPKPKRHQPFQLRYRIPQNMEPWAMIWPDLFRLPDFTKFNQTTRLFVCPNE